LITSVALQGLEKIINQALRLDPDTFKKLEPLSGKVIALDITDIGLCFYIQPETTGLRLSTTYDNPPDAKLRGNLLGLVKLGYSSLASDSSLNLTNNTVSIEGDLQLGQTLQHILQSLNIDWEEHLSHYVGDVVAHQIGSVVRQTRRGLQQAAHSLKKNITEHLQEDVQLQPSQLELQTFYKDVTALRDAVDRLEARLKTDPTSPL